MKNRLARHSKAEKVNKKSIFAETRKRKQTKQVKGRLHSVEKGSYLHKITIEKYRDSDNRGQKNLA